MGDVFYGLLLWLLGGVLSTAALFLTDTVDLDTGEIGELSLGMVALALAGGWVGFVGWPLVATYLKGQRSLARDFGLEIRWTDVGWGVLGGFAALAASVAAGIVWVVVSGDDAPGNGEFLPSSPGLVGGLLLWVLVAVCTPIAEELFFRGLVLRAIGRRWGIPVAVALSSLLFGCFHASGLTFSGLFIVAVTGIYGLVFALLVVRADGRLGPAIVAHAVVNSAGILTLVFG